MEQTDWFLAWSESRHWLHAAWITLVYTGLRRSELLGLQWGDVDLVNGLLRVRRGVTLIKDQGAGERLEIGPPKSGRDRVIDIDADVVAALRAWRKEVAHVGFERIAAGGWIFAADSGGPRHPERFSRIWRNAVGTARRETAAALPPGTDVDEVLPITHLHGLRHAHASHLLESGAQVKVVQERLGHASPTITHNVYSHLTPTAQRDAVAKLMERRTSARLTEEPGGAEAGGLAQA